MKRTVGIMQPTYLPWLGYFEQIARVDMFIFLDSVQFERRSWQCRNRIVDDRGDTVWLTIPVQHQPRESRILDIRIADEQPDWGLRHVRRLVEVLRGAPHLDSMLEAVRPEMERPGGRLVDVTIPLIRKIATELELETEFVRSSELDVAGSKADLIVNLLKHVGATNYYASAGSAVYLEPSAHLFAESGIEYRYQDWEHPTYGRGPNGFVSHLACVDALGWAGFDSVTQMLRPGRQHRERSR